MHRLPVQITCWIFPGTSIDLNFAGRSAALCGMWRSPKAKTSTISPYESTQLYSNLKQRSRIWNNKIDQNQGIWKFAIKSVLPIKPSLPLCSVVEKTPALVWSLKNRDDTTPLNRFGIFNLFYNFALLLHMNLTWLQKVFFFFLFFFLPLDL